MFIMNEIYALPLIMAKLVWYIIISIIIISNKITGGGIVAASP
jgi:hypothetical protein